MRVPTRLGEKIRPMAVSRQQTLETAPTSSSAAGQVSTSVSADRHSRDDGPVCCALSVFVCDAQLIGRGLLARGAAIQGSYRLFSLSALGKMRNSAPLLLKNL